MRTHHMVSIVLSLVVAGSGMAQSPQRPMPSMAPAPATTPCAVLQLNGLENNPSVLKAAQDLSGQIVHNYDPRSPQSAPQAGEFWGTFNASVLEALHPDCTNAPMAQTASTLTAQSKATTSQTNTQTGATGGGSGSTSLGQKVGIPQLLAIAVENGAIADSVSGTTMTLSTTPYGFVYAFAKNNDTSENYQNQLLLTHTGGSATFNIADTSDPFQSASRKAISQWQLKFTFRDTSTRSLAVNCLYLFKPGTAECHKKSDLLQAPTSDLAIAGAAIVQKLSSDKFAFIRKSLQKPEDDVLQRAWTPTLQKLVVAGNTDEFGKTLLLALDNDPVFQRALKWWADELTGTSSNMALFVQSLEAADVAYANAESQFETDVKNLTKGLNGDFAFSQHFPSPTTSSTSTATSSTTVSPPAYLAPELDISYEPKTNSSSQTGSKANAGAVRGVPSFTGNFSGGFYSNPKASLHESTFRGAQAALQFQWNLGAGPFYRVKSAGDDSQTTLCFSGSYQRLEENKDQKGKRPDLVTGSVKLAVPIASGASFPLAISFGNATSQVKGNYVVGNFGISFDLDSLAALAKLKQ